MPSGAVVAFRVILAPDIDVMTYLLTYLLTLQPGFEEGNIVAPISQSLGERPALNLGRHRHCRV